MYESKSDIWDEAWCIGNDLSVIQGKNYIFGRLWMNFDAGRMNLANLSLSRWVMARPLR